MSNNFFLSIMKQNRTEGEVITRIVLIGVGIILVLCLVFGSFYKVSPGYRGVKVTLGKVDKRSYMNGIGMKWPFISNMVKMNVQTQAYQDSLDAYTNDMQNVIIHYTINYELKADCAPEVYEKVGLGYEEKLIPGRFFEVTKSEAGKFQAQALISDRNSLSTKVQDAFRQKLQKECDYFANVIVQITDLQFSTEFDKTNENKEIERQLALTAENKTKRVSEEAKQKVIAAEADAKAMQIQAEALAKNKELVSLEWVRKWDGKMPTTYVAGKDGAAIYMPAIK